ncbi:Conserved_hypothetical protein [Hexamita inflata]|uniref:Leucine rich repeat protein n=1 Tax=Hexamita inflata TaxID=28002 RepID=A0AA86NB52_9EUKA|nr:Conserved hypothetical protein [Hexamita inflata]
MQLPAHQENIIEASYVINKSEISQVLSEYDQTMVLKYQNKIKYGMLAIKNDPKLIELDFIQFFKIHTIEFYDCVNLFPKLESKIIKQLKIKDCEIYRLKDLQIENLEYLELFNSNRKYSKTLSLEIVKYKKLKELRLYGCIDDISSFSQLTDLNILFLKSCEIRSTTALRPLINLVELCLDYNDGLNITSLQYLTSLTKLHLESCGLVSLDPIKPLIKLKELNIKYNNIVYIQPLLELTLLSKLDARYNIISDSKTIEQHQNFKNFIFGKSQPTQIELQEANILKSINTPISQLIFLSRQANNSKNKIIIFRKKISEILQKQYENHSVFIFRVMVLIQQVNGDEVDQ